MVSPHSFPVLGYSFVPLQRQSPKGHCYTIGVTIPESQVTQVHLIDLRSTLNTLTCSAVGQIMLFYYK